MPDLKEALEKAPKSELHVHLRGAMPIKVLTFLLNKYPVKEILRNLPDGLEALFQRFDNIRPFLSQRSWSEEAVSGLFNYKSFDQFLATYAFTGFYFRDVSDLRRLIMGVIDRLKSQNVVYAEITIVLINYLRQGVPLEDIRACLDEAAETPGIRVQWIVDLVRDVGSKAALNTLHRVIELNCESIVGITLGGSEHRFPPGLFSRIYSTAKKHGLRLSVHAGEARGPSSVWDALRILGAERIGHGVRAIEDEALVSYLAESRICLEVCPTSNLKTGIYPSYDAHPVKALYKAGVPITINTDDPTFFGTTLKDEYVHVLKTGMKADDILQLIKNGFQYAFLPKQEIETYLAELNREWKRLCPAN